jgi:chlorobactene glucosyltransferase
MDYTYAILIMLITIISSIFFSWIYFLIYTIKFLIHVPKLQSFKTSKNIVFPKVSVILPARNEENYIQKCLKTLIEQDYSNYEIIAINDSSTDKTGELIENFSLANSKVIYVDAKSKPNGWTGKCWACYQGYLKSTGDLFLFTDADTIHSYASISLAVSHLLAERFDALTAIPKIMAIDFWTKITLPILWTLSLAKYSALHANNPNSKVGYFFGSFFIITRKTYEAIGTHKAVRKEIVEDGALGRKVKEQGFKLNVVHGKDQIQAVWARDPNTLWNGLRRLMISIYEREKINAYLMVFATFLLLLFPLVIFFFSLSMVLQQEDLTNYMFKLDLLLLSLTIASMLLLIITSILELKYSILQNTVYSLCFPLSSSFVFIAFLTSIINSKSKYLINWKDRIYSIKENEDIN